MTLWLSERAYNPSSVGLFQVHVVAKVLRVAAIAPILERAAFSIAVSPSSQPLCPRYGLGFAECLQQVRH